MRDFYDFTVEKYGRFNNFLTTYSQELKVVSIIPLPKSFSRYEEKVVNDYLGDFTKIKDVLRASFLFKTKEELLVFVNQNNLEVVGVKNRLSRGYSDVCITFLFEGVKCELQLHLPYCLAAKDKLELPELAGYNRKLWILSGLGHKLYEFERSSCIPKFWALVGVGFYTLAKILCKKV